MDSDTPADEFPPFGFSCSVSDFHVILDQDLTLSKHVYLVCREWFYQSRQLPVVSRSRTFNSTATLDSCTCLHYKST